MNKVLDTIKLAEGFSFDMKEAWIKITTRQFGGNPVRAFAELIQNSLDSYDSKIPFEDRIINIISGYRTISITDFGVGFSLEKFKLLLTLGGTDKATDNSKIGRFGVGFFSIFNKKLGTLNVRVITICEDVPVFLNFKVTDPDAFPELTSGVLDEKPDFSSKIEIVFDNDYSVSECLKQSKLSLKNYPCLANINGGRFMSIWEEAKQNKKEIFKIGTCHGFINERSTYAHIDILCHYEFIISLTYAGLSTGGQNMTYDLRDYQQNSFPLLQDTGLTINYDNLRLTISRDSFFLDHNYTYMLNIIRDKLQHVLLKQIKAGLNANMIISNLFIFQDDLRNYFNYLEKGEDITKFHPLIACLANAEVFQISNEKNKQSLAQMVNHKSPDLPLFFSVYQSNLRWLGGAFKHDFIVLPSKYAFNNYSSSFYLGLFNTLFNNDTVNLDDIQNNKARLSELVNRGIIKKEQLDMKLKIMGKRNLAKKEFEFLEELTTLFANNEIKAVLENNLQIKINKVIPVFYDIEDKGVYISTGILNADGLPLSAQMISNLYEQNKKEGFEEYLSNDIMLGLMINHPFIKHLLDSDDKHRAYFTLTFVAHELTLCQKQLVPFSTIYHLTKEKIAGGMRKALSNTLIQTHFN